MHRSTTSTTRSLWTLWSSPTKASSPFWTKHVWQSAKSRTRSAWRAWTPNWLSTRITRPARWEQIRNIACQALSPLLIFRGHVFKEKTEYIWEGISENAVVTSLSRKWWYVVDTSSADTEKQQWGILFLAQTRVANIYFFFCRIWMAKWNIDSFNSHVFHLLTRKKRESLYTGAVLCFSQ